jgi:hypothetical protein
MAIPVAAPAPAHVRVLTYAGPALALAAVSVAVAWNGGYSADAQWAFASLALGAALVTPRVLGALRSLPILALVLLGLLAVSSAAWTIGEPRDAVRAGLVAAGYAAVAAVALVSRVPPRGVAVVLAAAAALCALDGLVSAARFSTASAEWLDGGWRPEGPFGYPPALALLQVFALPVVLVAMARARAVVAGAAAGVAVLAAGVLATSGSRLEIALAAAVCGGALIVPVASRLRTSAAIGLLALAGLVLHAGLGGWVWRRATEPGAGRLVLVVAVVVAAGPAWLAVRRLLPDVAERRAVPTRVWVPAAAALAAVAIGVGLATASPLDPRRFDVHHGLTHGRTWIWSAAARTLADRPIAGSGAGTFLEATLARQPGHGRVTRFAHDLPLEEGVELGAVGLLAALLLYVAAGVALVRRARGLSAWLVAPAAAAFLVSNLFDWTWHLAGIGALWALALGSFPGVGSGPLGRRRLDA